MAFWSETATDSTLVVSTVMGADGKFSFEEGPMESYTLRGRGRVADRGGEHDLRRDRDDEVNSSYISPYPSAFVTYESSERRQVRLSYNKHVERPTLRDRNPIEDNDNPTVRECGSPGLDLEYSHFS